MSPQNRSQVSLYDVLGVPRDASAETIKQAWREATDTYEPGTGSAQFRLFNEAADTLLDPARRADYDKELGDVEGAGATGSALTTPPEPERKARTPRSTTAAPASRRPAAAATTTVATQETTGDEVEAEPTGPTEAPRTRAVLTRGWVAAVSVLLVLAVVAVVTAAIFWSKQRDDAAADEAGQEASAAAERSLGPVLSYDYRRLKADRARAVPFLSTSYRTEYTKTFDQLIEATTAGQPGPAEKAQAVVKAQVTNVGIADAEPDRVRLVVFLNQSTSKNGGDPSFSLNRLGVSMVKSGSSWLVDNIVSY